MQRSDIRPVEVDSVDGCDKLNSGVRSCSCSVPIIAGSGSAGRRCAFYAFGESGRTVLLMRVAAAVIDSTRLDSVRPSAIPMNVLNRLRKLLYLSAAMFYGDRLISRA